MLNNRESKAKLLITIKLILKLIILSHILIEIKTKLIRVTLEGLLVTFLLRIRELVHKFFNRKIRN